MIPVIVPTYAAVLALIYVFLSLRVARTRMKARVIFGTGNNSDLERKIRIHGNFSEYVPFALLLLAFLEMQGRPAIYLHILCCMLIAARLLHAYAIAGEKQIFPLRVIGIIATFAVIIIASVSLIARSLPFGERRCCYRLLSNPPKPPPPRSKPLSPWRSSLPRSLNFSFFFESSLRPLKRLLSPLRSRGPNSFFLVSSLN